MNRESREWTTSEIKFLRANAAKGAQWIAADLGRSLRSVQGAAHRHRVSLRCKGSSRGVILGQPRGVSWRLRGHLLHRLLIAAGVDVTGLEERIRKETSGTGEWCPRCTARLVAVRSTGLCEVCHWKALAQAMREKDEATEARREYWKERERRKRRVSCEVCHEEYSPRLEREGRKSDRNVCPSCRGGSS